MIKIKELIESIILAKTHFTGDGAVNVISKMSALLEEEVEFQLNLQSDIIKAYKADKAKEQLKSSNVTPIKKDT